MNTQLSPQQQRDHAFARRINHETRANPGSPYAHKYLGIANEQVVVVADSLDEVEAQLDALGYGRDDSMLLEASADYDTPIMFSSPWEMRAVSSQSASDANIAIR